MEHYHQMGGTASINPKKGFSIHLLIFLLTTPVIWAVWYYFTDRAYVWPLWQTAGWAVGIIFHYLGVFVFKKPGRI